MFWYILVCSMIGGISVSVTTGLGAAIVRTAMGDNQVCFLYYYAGYFTDMHGSLNTGSCTSYLYLLSSHLVSVDVAQHSARLISLQ